MRFEHLRFDFRPVLFGVSLSLTLSASAHAQMTMPMPQSSPPPSASPAKPQTNNMDDMSDMDMSGGMMAGALGRYSMMRDASGTSWQPDSTPMQGIMGSLGGWSTMVDATITGVFDDQTGPRGDTKPFSESMLMGMAQNQ